MIRYYLEIFADPTDARRRILLDALADEVRNLGIHRTVALIETDSPPKGEPSIGIYLGSPQFASDAETTAKVAASLAHGRAIVPVVDDLTNYLACVPSPLRLINGVQWETGEAGRRLAGTVLEGLGIAEQQRRVFISHKRDDGMAVAAQLHDRLAQHGFSPFIDRFRLAPGRDVQQEIANQLEDCALLLLVETPLAHESDWVFDEVDYVLSRNLGLHIITWPDVSKPVPGTVGLARQHLTSDDIVPVRGFETLTERALEQVVISVEAEHARTLVRRRRYLLTSLADAARDAGLECVPMPGWGTLVTGQVGTSIVQVTPRVPTVDDLYELDKTRAKFPDAPPGVLVHAPRHIPAARREVLTWAGASRDLTLVPENAIGGYWRGADVR